MDRVTWFVFLVFALAACGGSEELSEAAQQDALEAATSTPATSDPEVEATPPRAATPTATAIPTPTVEPTPTATPLPTAIPEPTPVEPTPTERQRPTIQAVAEAGAAVLNVGVDGMSIDPAAPLCDGVLGFAATYPPLEAARSGTSSSPSSDLFFVMRFADEATAMSALLEDRKAAEACLNAANIPFESSQDWVGHASGDRVRYQGFATAGDLMIRTVSYGSEVLDQRFIDLLETLRTAGETIDLAPRRPEASAAEFSVAFEPYLRSISVVDTDDVQIASFDEAVVMPAPARDAGLETLTECESPDNLFGGAWVEGEIGPDATLFCGELLPIQAIDAVSGEPSETGSARIARSCPDAYYRVRQLRPPLIFSDAVVDGIVSLDSATVLTHQCVLR